MVVPAAAAAAAAAAADANTLAGQCFFSSRSIDMVADGARRALIRQRLLQVLAQDHLRMPYGYGYIVTAKWTRMVQQNTHARFLQCMMLCYTCCSIQISLLVYVY